MKKRIIILLALSMLILNLLAIFDDYEPSARARAMGGAYTAVSNDASAVFYNPAGLSLAGKEINIGYTNIYSSDFLQLKTVAGSYDSKRLGSFGFGIKTFDVPYLDVTLLSEQTYSLAHSIALIKDINSEVYLGYNANYNTIKMDANSSTGFFGVNVGAMAILHKRTFVGFSVTNVNKPMVGKEGNYDVARKLSAGLAYIPYEGVITSIDLKKPFDGDTEFHAGTEITIYEILFLRAGIKNDPASFSGGLGILVSGMKVDYGMNTHSVLGLTHHVSIGYKF